MNWPLIDIDLFYLTTDTDGKKPFFTKVLIEIE